MGAFGRYLIKSWGGNLKAYDDADSVSYEKKPETKEDILEREEIFLLGIQQSAQSIVDKGELMIKQLQEDEKIYEVLTNKKIQKKFFKWREQFLKGLNK